MTNLSTRTTAGVYFVKILYFQ